MMPVKGVPTVDRDADPLPLARGPTTGSAGPNSPPALAPTGGTASRLESTNTVPETVATEARDVS